LALKSVVSVGRRVYVQLYWQMGAETSITLSDDFAEKYQIMVNVGGAAA
jgi:hypothetical protein